MSLHITLNDVYSAECLGTDLVSVTEMCWSESEIAHIVAQIKVCKLGLGLIIQGLYRWMCPGVVMHMICCVLSIRFCISYILSWSPLLSFTDGAMNSATWRRMLQMGGKRHFSAKFIAFFWKLIIVQWGFFGSLDDKSRQLQKIICWPI